MIVYQFNFSCVLNRQMLQNWVGHTANAMMTKPLMEHTPQITIIVTH